MRIDEEQNEAIQIPPRGYRRKSQTPTNGSCRDEAQVHAFSDTTWEVAKHLEERVEADESSSPELSAPERVADDEIFAESDFVTLKPSRKYSPQKTTRSGTLKKRSMWRKKKDISPRRQK